MRTPLIYLIAAGCFSLLTISPLQAESEPSTSDKNLLTGTFELGYTSRYIWRSIDLYPDDNGGVFSSLVFNLGETGAYLGIFSMIPLRDENRSWQEFDWFGGYATTLFADESHAIDLDIGYTYYDFYLSKKGSDFQEVAAKFSFPNLIQVGEGSLIPYGSAVYAWPATAKGYNSGWWGSLGVRSSIPLPHNSLTQDQQGIDIYVETFYTENGAPFAIEKGFTHIEAGLSTTWDAHGVAITPGLHYSWTLEETANGENEIWADVTLAVPF